MSQPRNVAVALGPEFGTVGPELIRDAAKEAVRAVAVVRHESLAAGRWHEMPLVEQLANIGSEVGRATRAKSLGNEQR